MPGLLKRLTQGAASPRAQVAPNPPEPAEQASSEANITVQFTVNTSYTPRYTNLPAALGRLPRGHPQRSVAGNVGALLRGELAAQAFEHLVAAETATGLRSYRADYPCISEDNWARLGGELLTLRAVIRLCDTTAVEASAMLTWLAVEYPKSRSPVTNEYARREHAAALELLPSLPDSLNHLRSAVLFAAFRWQRPQLTKVLKAAGLPKPDASLAARRLYQQLEGATAIPPHQRDGMTFEI